MSGYNMNYFVKDFSDRTNKNTDILKRTGKNYYEVTHLINSLLGLVIIPHEAYFENANNMKAAKDCSEEFEKIDSIVNECIDKNKYYCDYEGDQTAIQFIHHIRNSLSHGGNEGLLFCPVTEGAAEEITSIIFYDNFTDKNGITHQFCVELSLEQIKKLVKVTTNLFIKIEVKAGGNDWDKRAEKFRSLFELKEQKYTNNREYIIKGRSNIHKNLQ